MSADGYYRMPGSTQPLLKPRPSLPDVSFGQRKVYAAVGVLFGVCAAVVFSGAVPQFSNEWAAALGAGSGMVALVAFWEHRRRQAAELAGEAVEANTTLLRIFAVLSGCVGIAGFLGFLASGLYELEKVTVESSYVSAVWGFLLAKWGVLLLYYTNSYSRRDEIREELGLVPPSSQASSA